MHYGVCIDETVVIYISVDKVFIGEYESKLNSHYLVVNTRAFKNEGIK